MTNPVEMLQAKLAQDLVDLERTDISEEHLQIIESAYEQVYRLLNKAAKE